jgi:hypothetical protein
MKNKIFSSLFLTAAVTMLTLTLGAGLTFAAHPDIPLYTYEEIGMQFTPNFNPADYTTAPPAPGTDFNMMPVMVNAAGKGFPYSPKQTCGNCHNGTTTRWDSGQAITDAAGTPILTPLVSYNDMSTQAFHAELGAEEWLHDDDTDPVTGQSGKPWSSSTGMWGKW